MNLVNEYALLVAVSLPAAVVAAMQVYLYLAGERGTLLMPYTGAFPSLLADLSQPVVDLSPASSAARPVEEAANETCEQAA